jgi:acetolactate synthase-1/2/3 large subunit
VNTPCPPMQSVVTVGDERAVSRRGADALISASVSEGVAVCFANPGTTEMAIVDALRAHDQIRAVPTLFEGVASGAADGYARLANKPASVLLHLGPGLANASANLHNAKRAQSSVVCWIGDHTRWLRPYDPPLHSNIESIAHATAQWVLQVLDTRWVTSAAQGAIQAARGPRRGVSMLVLPADVMEEKNSTPATAMSIGFASQSLDIHALVDVDDEAQKLRQARSPLLLLGGAMGDEESLRRAHQIAHRVGGTVLLEQFPTCVRRSPGVSAPERLAYLPFQARAQLANHDRIVLVGADAPVCFFGYEGQAPSLAPDGCPVVDTVGAHGNGHVVLDTLAQALDCTSDEVMGAETLEAASVTGALQPVTLCRSLAQALPDNAIVVDEGITGSLPLYSSLRGAAPHDLLTCKGGSLGFSMPAATGAAIACPDRRVISYVGDGASLYTIQALWTQAREGLDVTTIVLVNRKYAVLQFELMRTNAPVVGDSDALTTLNRPDIDYVALANGFGVPAQAVSTLDAFQRALTHSFQTSGPTLIAVIQ